MDSKIEKTELLTYTVRYNKRELARTVYIGKYKAMNVLVLKRGAEKGAMAYETWWLVNKSEMFFFLGGLHLL